MKKVRILFFTGLLFFMSGISLSAFLSTHFVIIGTAFAVIGGFLMGGSSYFLPKPKK